MTTKSTLKFSANLTMLFVKESKEILGRYTLAAKAGFKYVETPFPYEATPDDLARVLEEHGLQQVLINTEVDHHLGYASLVGKETEFRTNIEKALEYCVATKCKVLHIMAGIATEDQPASRQVYTENLKWAGQLLAKNDIVGVIEPLSIKPGYFLNSFTQAEEIIKDVDSPNIKLLMDFYHMQRICGNLTRNVEKLMPITGHVQVAQVPNRDEPNHEGEINFEYVFKLLENSGYSGYVGLEYTPNGTTAEGVTCFFEKF